LKVEFECDMFCCIPLTDTEMVAHKMSPRAALDPLCRQERCLNNNTLPQRFTALVGVCERVTVTVEPVRLSPKA
jgi:hypothetical protein